MKELYDIWFSSLDIENSYKLNLLKNYTAEEIWNLGIDELAENGIDATKANLILKGKSLEETKRSLEYMQKNNIKLICVNDKLYPQKLHNIEDKPALLYVRGDNSILDDDAVGIVGCRMATNEGNMISRKIAKALADRNINIISGLALGIDKYAHLGALDSKIGKTVAVLGTSVADDEMYPYENKRVFDRILENGGAIVSEYCFGVRPEKKHFPARNRIISGLSDKLIVVEAKKRSGSLITANWAIEQGKDVFAVPGGICTPNSVGTNNLIKEGAYLFSNIEDIFAFHKY